LGRFFEGGFLIQNAMILGLWPFLKHRRFQ
jgi:hypothetical protein